MSGISGVTKNETQMQHKEGFGGTEEECCLKNTTQADSQILLGPFCTLGI